MPREIVETIYDIEGRQRVHIFRRDDGTYGFYEEYFSTAPRENCWVPRFPSSEPFCDTFETAIREVSGRVSWL